MKTTFQSLIFVSLIAFVGCVAPQKEKTVVKTGFFEGKSGCFLLYNMKTAKFDKVLGEDCSKRLPACSTFKVPLAIMAFDSGVLPGESFVLKWDGKKDRFRDEPNRDHNAKTWMRDSVVWFSQRITPQLGPKKLQRYLNDFNYGNKDFSQGIKTAWLTRPDSKIKGLEITAYEQVDFMARLWSDSLPVSKKSMDLTRQITFLEKSPKGFNFSGKTGSNFYDEARKQHFGWFVGHIENGKDEYIVVTNLSDLKPSDEPGYGGAKAKDLTKKILASQGLW